jgi:mannose-6-phosphate isomerase
MDKTVISSWLATQALPLWSTTGFDAETGTVWEALDHKGAPLRKMTRRLRVQARQAYCFAAGATQAPELVDLNDQALMLFRFALEQGVDPVSGNLGSLLNPDATLQAAAHDLYDVAFMLLAASALIRAGHEIETELAQVEAMLARLEAPRGWYESAAQAQAAATGGEIGRRRQNPHMHMFECATALYAATGEARFKDMAQVSLDLFRDVFLQPDGAVFEYFTADWQPLDEGQAVEPGHMVEWVYLLDTWEQVTGESAGVDMMSIFTHACAARDASGALPDSSRPKAQTRRCWPQTELLKASIALTRRGETLPAGADPDTVMQMLWDEYLDVPVAGGWYDKRGLDGKLLSDNMPASTFYHILVALNMYLAA